MRSLAFVRLMERVKPRFPTARSARYAVPFMHEGPPPLSGIAWFEVEPYDNVAIGVGNHLVLAIAPNGWPKVMPYNSPYLGKYVGWSTGLPS